MDTESYIFMSAIHEKDFLRKYKLRGHEYFILSVLMFHIKKNH
jgi:hypothetical protein